MAIEILLTAQVVTHLALVAVVVDGIAFPVKGASHNVFKVFKWFVSNLTNDNFGKCHVKLIDFKNLIITHQKKAKH